VKIIMAAFSSLVRGMKHRQVSPTPATLTLTAAAPGVTGNGVPYEIPFLVTD